MKDNRTSPIDFGLLWLAAHGGPRRERRALLGAPLPTNSMSMIGSLSSSSLRVLVVHSPPLNPA
jgi:hypothetical protein